MPPKYKRPASKYAKGKKFVAADDGDGAEPASKRTKGSAKPASPKEIGKKHEDEEGNAYWEIGGRLRRVTVSKFRGNVFVNIREHYEKDGKVLPGKKGISLNTEQFESLVSALPQIETSLAAEGIHIGRPEYSAAPPAQGGAVQSAVNREDSEEAARGEGEEEEEKEEEKEEEEGGGKEGRREASKKKRKRQVTRESSDEE